MANKDIKPIAVIGLTNTGGISILHIINTEYIEIVGPMNDYHCVKLYHNSKHSYFIYGGHRYSLNDAMRV